MSFIILILHIGLILKMSFTSHYKCHNGIITFDFWLCIGYCFQEFLIYLITLKDSPKWLQNICLCILQGLASSFDFQWIFSLRIKQTHIHSNNNIVSYVVHILNHSSQNSSHSHCNCVVAKISQAYPKAWTNKPMLSDTPRGKRVTFFLTLLLSKST